MRPASGGVTAKLKSLKVSVPRVRLVEVIGAIDETFEGASGFQSLATERTPIVIDVGGVRRITSVGVRNWIAGLEHLGEIDYFFVHCRPALVWQFNMILSFGGHGRMLSMFLPYACPSCGQESEQLIDLRSEYTLVKTAQPPEHTCTSCGAVTEFDEDPGSYFAHASAHPPEGLPAPVAALLDDAAKTTSAPLKIRKEVTPDVTAVWLSGSIQDSVRFKRIAEGLDGAVVVVAQSVRGVTAGGLTKLFGALTAESSQVYVARASLELAAMLSSHPAGAQVSIVSLWLGLGCDGCAEIYSQELDRDRWLASRKGVNPDCARCGRPLSPILKDAGDRLSKINLGVSPPMVAAYLATHAEAPFQTDSARPPRPRSQAMRAALPELQLDGYEIIGRLGIGGMAEVMLARQVGPEGFNKLVALKRILPALASDPLFVEMFLREARIAALITHANVVQIYDLRKSADDFFIVMEYVPGWNLERVLTTASLAMTPLPIELACRIVADVCAGLYAAHTATLEDGQPLVVVHRDVSPHNVLVSKAGSIKLTDFGIAKATNIAAITKTDGLKGKFLYMAPERLEGNDSDTRSDLFAAGLILFLALTQVHPFQGASEYIIWEKALQSRVPAPSTLRPDIPPALDELVLRAVARQPDDRYQSAQELHLALERFLAAYGRPATTTHLARWLSEVVVVGEAQTEVGPVEILATTPGFLKQS